MNRASTNKILSQAQEDLQDLSQEHRHSKKFTTKIWPLQDRQTSGVEKEASLETIRSDPSWTYESQASHSATTTNTNRKIFNRWLNKEVPYTTMSNTKKPTISQPTNSHRINLNTNTKELPSNTITSNHSSLLFHQQVSPSESNTSTESTTGVKSNSSHQITSLSLQNPTHSNLTNRSMNNMLHLNQQNEALHQNESLRRQTNPLKIYSSDSNLAINYTEKKSQNLPKKSQEAPVYSHDPSRKKSMDSKNHQVHQTRYHLERQNRLEENPDQRAQLNRKRAETLWGKEINSDENQALCRNSLPRQSPAFEARSKLLSSIDAQIDNVELEIQDILAQPLLAEITISSPSLFDETNSSQSSSPPITVQTLK